MGDQYLVDGCLRGDPCDAGLDSLRIKKIAQLDINARLRITCPQVLGNALAAGLVTSYQGQVVRSQLQPEPGTVLGHCRGGTDDDDVLHVLHVNTPSGGVTGWS